MYVVYVSGLIYVIQFYGPKLGASAAAGVRFLGFVFGIASPLFSIPCESEAVGEALSIR
jgi:hypothetical protein